MKLDINYVSNYVSNLVPAVHHHFCLAYTCNILATQERQSQCRLKLLLPGSGVAHLVAAERVVVGGAVVAGAVVAVAAVGLLAGVLAHVHLEHGLPRRLVVAHLADVRLQLPVHRLKRRSPIWWIRFTSNFSVACSMGRYENLGDFSYV